MKFEDEFPSFEEGFNPEALMISKLAVQTYCLDKKRVKNIINKVFPIIEDNPDWMQYEDDIGCQERARSEINHKQRVELKKELGLIE